MNEQKVYEALEGITAHVDIPAGFIAGLVATLGVFVLVFFVIGVLLGAFTFWMIVDAAKRDKYWWIVLMVVTHIIGATIYYFKVKKPQMKDGSENSPQTRPGQ